MKKYRSFGADIKIQCSEETISFLNDLQGIPLEDGGLELIKKVGGYDGIVTITDRDGKRHLCGMKIGKDNDTSVNFDEIMELKEEEKMTREEAIRHLTSLRIHSQNRQFGKDIEALAKAVEVLEKQSDVLDKIRSEINSLNTYEAKFKDGFSLHIDKYSVLQIIDKYRAESEE